MVFKEIIAGDSDNGDSYDKVTGAWGEREREGEGASHGEELKGKVVKEPQLL